MAKKHKSNFIEQPPIREPHNDERVVKTAGLQFILPCVVKPGDVFDETRAQFYNAAWHHAVINRFTPIRQTMIENGANYEEIDRELQAFFDEFNYLPRQPSAKTEEKSAQSEEDIALEKFARNLFREHVRGSLKSRGDYEKRLKSWITENREQLVTLMFKEQENIQQLAKYFKPQEPKV